VARRVLGVARCFFALGGSGRVVRRPHRPKIRKGPWRVRVVLSPDGRLLWALGRGAGALVGLVAGWLVARVAGRLVAAWGLAQNWIRRSLMGLGRRLLLGWPTTRKSLYKKRRRCQRRPVLDSEKVSSYIVLVPRLCCNSPVERTSLSLSCIRIGLLARNKKEKPTLGLTLGLLRRC